MHGPSPTSNFLGERPPSPPQVSAPGCRPLSIGIGGVHELLVAAALCYAYAFMRAYIQIAYTNGKCIYTNTIIVHIVLQASHTYITLYIPYFLTYYGLHQKLSFLHNIKLHSKNWCVTIRPTASRCVCIALYVCNDYACMHLWMYINIHISMQAGISK